LSALMRLALACGDPIVQMTVMLQMCSIGAVFVAGHVARSSLLLKDASTISYGATRLQLLASIHRTTGFVIGFER